MLLVPPQISWYQISEGLPPLLPLQRGQVQSPYHVRQSISEGTKAGGIKNRPSAKKRGTPKSLRLENYTKSQRNI